MTPITVKFTYANAAVLPNCKTCPLDKNCWSFKQHKIYLQ